MDIVKRARLGIVYDFRSVCSREEFEDFIELDCQCIQT